MGRRAGLRVWREMSSRLRAAVSYRFPWTRKVWMLPLGSSDIARLGPHLLRPLISFPLA